MPEPFRLFVYGHLRRGQSGCRLLELEQRTEWLGEAQVRGRLYDLGDYPGLVLGSNDIVQGELIAFDDPALWTALDAYEDCDPDDPDTSEYRRIEIDLPGGDRAWTYVYNRPVESLDPIASGAWQGV
ncbi:MAG: gamma-glutamylcyclotransferase [Sphingobium sp.]|nr:gamma-glutamylcyclotransferase [Sphingobium sp.]